MPRTMQQSMVRIRPMIRKSPAARTIALMSMEARPVTVMQPAIMPASAHATATAMELRAPAAKASAAVHRAVLQVSSKTLPNVSSSVRSSQLVSRKWMKPITNATKIEMAADTAMV